VDTRNPDLDGKVLGGFNAVTNSTKEEDYQDDNGHGTHVAGIIAAARGNAWGVAGVAPEASLYAVKVLDHNGLGSLSNVVNGIIWCVNNKMQVINLSLGGPVDSEGLHEAVMLAEIMGLVVVAAAGNDGGQTNYPAAFKEAISVSAGTPDDKLANFSSRGKVDFIAPGTYIVSLARKRETTSLSGTSMAAPHVSALAALAVSLGARGLHGPDGVYEALRKAAARPAGLDAADAGHGVIDAGKLLP
jgi:thermitase